MPRNMHIHALSILVAIVLVPVTVHAGSFNYSLCAERAYQTFSNAPNNSFLYDQHGKPTGSLTEAWGISYSSCKALCGTKDNTGYYDWGFLSQGLSSWLIPWLALSAQLPFETKDKMTNFMTLLLSLGSPTLVAYSLALTILDARRINQTFRQIIERTKTLHRPLQLEMIRAARSVLIEIQHVPIQIHNGRRREIAQLIVDPTNWTWWSSLRQKLLITKREWTYSLYAQVGWVCISQLLAIIDFFTSASSVSSIGIGLAINSLWLWLIPIVLGWVYVGIQNSAQSVTAALTDTNVPILGFQRNLKGECIGFRERTICDQSDSHLQDSLDRHEPCRNQDPQLQGNSRFGNSIPDHGAPDAGLGTKHAYTRSALSQVPSNLQPSLTSSSKYPDGSYIGRPDELDLQALPTDRLISNTSTLQAAKERSQLPIRCDVSFDSLPLAFLGFSIAGDDRSPGPLYKHARIYTYNNAVKQLAEGFSTLSKRQERQETVNGHEWVQDQDSWDENLRGTPQQMSHYISPSYEDRQKFSVHAPGSADVVHNCVIAAFVAVFLQWGTTGAAIIIAFKTPTVGLGCQSGSYLIFGLASTVAWLTLILSAYLSHLYSLRFETIRRPPSAVLAALAVLTRLLGKLIATANAIFVIAISVIQFTGLFDNCWCDSCIPSLGKTAGWVVLWASDAQITAASRSAWVGGVSMGIVTGGVVTLWIFLARDDEVFGSGEL